MAKDRIYFVTTDKALAGSAQQVIGTRFDLALFDSAEEALAALKRNPLCTVFITGLTLPGMNGLQLLEEINNRAPKAIRMMITGDGDYETALSAVNKGHVYRILTKPCTPETLAEAVADALRLAQQERSESDLLRGTLHGIVTLLVQVLERLSPAAIGRSTRIRERVREIGKQLGLKPLWVLDMATMLSHIGCVGLPRQVLAKLESGEDMAPEEVKVFRKHPAMAAHLLGNIPRMESVAGIIMHQNTAVRDDPPPGARILRVCLDMDHLERKGAPPEKALELLRSKPEVYDARVVEALSALVGTGQDTTCVLVSVFDLEPGMVMGKDILTRDGTQLLLAGQKLSEISYKRLVAFADLLGVVEPVCVLPQKQKAS